MQLSESTETMAPWLARHDVGEVDLDGGDGGELQRVADRARVVRPGAGVDDDAVGEVAHAVQLLDELALVVGLEEARVEVELVREGVDRLLELEERHAAVVLGIAATDLVEVDPVHDVDAVAGVGHVRRGLWQARARGAAGVAPRRPATQRLRSDRPRAPRTSSSTAASTSAAATRWPKTAAPGAEQSTNGTVSPTRFLSIRVAATTAAGSASDPASSAARRRPAAPATCARSSSAPLSRSAASSPSATASPWR